MRPLACSGMHFEDASSRAFRLRRRREDDYCRVQPTSVCPFGVVGLWAMRCCGVSGAGVAVDAMAAERAEHERVQVQVQVQVRARMPLLPRRCRVLAGDSDYCVLHGVDVLGYCVKRGVGERLGRHVKKDFVERRRHGASSLRALAAAMRIARKRNRSPRNGAGRDDGSSQCSLL